MTQQTKQRRGQSNSWLRAAALLVIVAIGLYSAWQRQRLQQAPDRPTEPPAPIEIESERGVSIASTEKPDSARSVQTTIPRQIIHDQDGRVVFRGDVDIARTLDRIERGERLEFSHDGMTFENRERRLPRQQPGYYREYVHPTPRIGGPGPQRIVVGRGGETYYTPDHYRTFQRLDKP